MRQGRQSAILARTGGRRQLALHIVPGTVRLVNHLVIHQGNPRDSRPRILQVSPRVSLVDNLAVSLRVSLAANPPVGHLGSPLGNRQVDPRVSPLVNQLVSRPNLLGDLPVRPQSILRIL